MDSPWQMSCHSTELILAPEFLALKMYGLSVSGCFMWGCEVLYPPVLGVTGAELAESMYTRRS